MTLAPIDGAFLAKGLAGPTYRVGPNCANPKCSHFADHAHHIFRRSMLAGDFPWVEIEEKVFGNLTGLCADCHNAVTGNVGGHRAAIRLDLEQGIYWWCDVIEDGWVNVVDYQRVAPLTPQPPALDSLSERSLGQGSEPEHCPVCGQEKRRRRPASPPEPRRRRKNWTVSVPDDVEDGADVLDTFVDDVALLLGAGDWHERNKRYWALVHVLAWTMQRREEFARDVKAAV